MAGRLVPDVIASSTTRRALGALLIVVRNGLLLVGVFILGWQASEAVFWIWFDGLSSLLFTALVAMAAKSADDARQDWLPTGGLHVILVAIAVVLVLAIVAIPYGFAFWLLALHVFQPGLFTGLAEQPLTWLVLAATLIGNAVEAYLRRSVSELPATRHRHFDREYQAHAARAIAILIAALFPLGLGIILLAIGLALVELRQDRASKAASEQGRTPAL